MVLIHMFVCSLVCPLVVQPQDLLNYFQNFLIGLKNMRSMHDTNIFANHNHTKQNQNKLDQTSTTPQTQLGP